jgi:hypothetical protein
VYSEKDVQRLTNQIMSKMDCFHPSKFREDVEAIIRQHLHGDSELLDLSREQTTRRRRQVSALEKQVRALGGIPDHYFGTRDETGTT